MLTGFGGAATQHYLGLLADGPACLAAVVMAGMTSRQLTRGALKTAWSCMTAALALYFAGTVIAAASWLFDRDPFPGPADVFFLAFYPAVFAAVLFFVRARAMRIPWARLALDVVILAVGFGASFWFLAIRPVTVQAELDFLKQLLSQVYLALNCAVLLSLGLLLLTGPDGAGGRRVPLLLLLGCTTMTLADIVWALAKVGGGYLPGGLQDVMYVAWYLPIGVAAREQLRRPAPAVVPAVDTPPSLVHGLPYVAVLIAFLVLVYVARAEVGGPVAVMTLVAFVLTLLVMVRQGTMLRDDARTRERRATEMVEARYASLIANASDVILIVGEDGALRFASPAFERTFGLKPEDGSGRSLFDLWSGDDADLLRGFIAELAATPQGSVSPIELRLDRATHRYTLEIVGSNLTEDPAVRGLALNLRDISERKALEQRLWEQAFRDPLTRLANRNLFRDRVEHAIGLARRERRRVAVIFLDLDDFKNVNDTLGHDAGDRLLQAVADRLVLAMRTTDTVARLAGDEFAVLLEGVESVDDLERPAAALVQALGAPFVLGDSEMRVSASVGVALWTPGSAADELLSNADIAMYHAKSLGKGRYVVFEPRMQEALMERLRLEADIVRALANGELFLEYQPVVTLDTRRLLGVEALLRWNHPIRHLLTPEGLHSGGRGVGPRHRARALGAAASVRGLAALVPGDGRGAGPASGRERVRPSSSAGRPGPGRRRRAPDIRARPQLPGARAHREHHHAQHGREPRAAAPAEGPRRSTCHRRLRHRLLVTGVPAPVPDRHPEDRSLLRQPAGRWRGPRARTCGRHARADAGPRHGCRGH